MHLQHGTELADDLLTDAFVCVVADPSAQVGSGRHRRQGVRCTQRVDWHNPAILGVHGTAHTVSDAMLLARHMPARVIVLLHVVCALHVEPASSNQAPEHACVEFHLRQLQAELHCSVCLEFLMACICERECTLKHTAAAPAVAATYC
jgi:hypothetical protein